MHSQYSWTEENTVQPAYHQSHTSPCSAYRQTYSPAPALRLPKWLLSLWYWF